MIKYYQLPLFIVVLLIFQACAIKQPPKTLKSRLSLPDQFDAEHAAQASIDTLDYHLFFKDTALLSLIDTAIMRNYDLKIALQQIAKADATILSRRARLLPEGFAGGNLGATRYGDFTEEGVGNFDTNFSENVDADRQIPYPVTPTYQMGFTAGWEVDIWRKLRNMEKAAYFNYMATQEARQLLVTQVVSRVASLYFNLLEKENELDIIRKNIALQERAVELINIQKLAGGVTELAVKQFNAQLLNSRSLEYATLQEIYELEVGLNLMLGRSHQPLKRGVGILEQQLPEIINTGIPSDLLLNRPDLKQKEYELEAANANVYAARANFYPTLNLTAGLGFEAFKPQLLVTPQSLAANVLANITAPVFNKRRIKANLLRVEAENYALLQAYEQTTLQALSEVMISLKGIDNASNLYGLKVRQVDELRNAVLTSNDLFLSGFANYLEVITAQSAVFEAELELMRARNQQFLYLVELYRSLGGGWRDL